MINAIKILIVIASVIVKFFTVKKADNDFFMLKAEEGRV